jgi:hypothetical protein
MEKHMSTTKKEKKDSYSEKPTTEYKGEGSQTGYNNKRTKKNPGAGQSGSGHLNYG